MKRAAPEMLINGTPAILIFVIHGAASKRSFRLNGNIMAASAGIRNIAVQAMVELMKVVETDEPKAQTAAKISAKTKVTTIAFTGVWNLSLTSAKNVGAMRSNDHAKIALVRT